MTVPLPWTLHAGARFSLPRAGHPTQTDANPTTPYDPMRDDVFDIEADFYMEATSRLNGVVVQNHGTIRVGALSVPAPASIAMDGHLGDTYGALVGGDINVVPGVFAVRAGFSFETSPESADYAQVHLPAYASYGLHGGASVRFGPITASVAYVHYFLAGLDAANGMRAVTSTGGTVTSADCASAGPGACSINKGTYSGSDDLLSASLAAHF